LMAGNLSGSKLPTNSSKVCYIWANGRNVRLVRMSS
jgi:hypothetical protein